MSILGNIQGKTGENISTEVLAYFLSAEEGIAPFQRLFFSCVLGSPNSSEELDVQIKTQVDLGHSGIPDLMMLFGNGDTLIILENKLGSYLSGESQLLRYAEAFNKEEFIKKYFSPSRPADMTTRILLFLAPRKTISISRLSTNDACIKKHHLGFTEYLRDNSIKFQTIEWETVIGWLDKRDGLQKELFLFVEDFLSQELTEGEKMALQNPEIPTSLRKLFRNIAAISSEVQAKKWKIGRMTQSYLWYGFNIETDMTRLYFGYSIPLWEECKTPVILQVKETDFILEKELVQARLIKLGFNYRNDNKTLVRPFKIESINNWKKDIFDILESLNNPDKN